MGDRFHASLDTVLSTRMGRRAEIWRDAKLSGNDVFSDQILEQLPRAAILVSIISPRYVESEWCLREVREFVQAAERSSSLLVENKSRVIKVIKLPVDTEDSLPTAVKQVLGYSFFTIGDDHAPIELDPAYGEKLVQGYNLKIAKLAWDITQLVKKLEVDSAQPAPGTIGPAVYLSECSYDRRDSREALEAELRMHGYTVLPDAELPRGEDAYRAEAARHLQKCSVSVHLIGNLYGSVPDGPSQKSVVVVQNELAIAESRRRGLPRIIWVPKGTEPRSAEQQEFVQRLHTTAEAQFGADLITDDIEAVKTAVREALKRLQKPEAPLRASAAASSRLIYVVCDARDRKETIPLRRLLQRAGFEVEIPVFSGDAATVRQANQELLTQCDAAVLFYGAGDGAWKRTVENDPMGDDGGVMSDAAAALLLAVSYIVYGLYIVLPMSSRRMATPGMRAVGIIATDIRGERLSFLRALGRFFASYLSVYTMGIGFFIQRFTKRRQTLHDLVAGTVVLKAPPTSS